MLNSRTQRILKSIIEQYISRAVPVPSQRIVDDYTLGVSPATIRNEMVVLEREGYLIRPYSSSGSIPTDKGYRFYVESLTEVSLPLGEQRLISHLFHQVERELSEALHLAAALMSQTAQNVALVTIPKATGCRFKHVELVSVQDSLVLLILVLYGANVRQKLITFEGTSEGKSTQEQLTVIANKLSAFYAGMTHSQISNAHKEITPVEEQVTSWIVKIMEAEDSHRDEESYLHGLRYMLNQPEFAQTNRMEGLMELVERHELLRTILPREMRKRGVQVLIGKENRSEVIHDYSVVISHYGLPGEAVGTIGVLGPTRMHYARAIATVAYLSSVLSALVSDLYKRQAHRKNPPLAD
ncbi:MAG: heat-inducible transcription repressor HrcA [Chloroflexi bacterium]|nr:heat-inducible transcription repressor HrcA [Chloroflexota bacterium]